LHVGHTLKLQIELAPVVSRKLFDLGQSTLKIARVMACQCHQPVMFAPVSSAA
jgi:hypothetical protein